MLYIKPNRQKNKEYQLLSDFINTDFFSRYTGNQTLEYSLLEEPFTGLGYTDLVVIVWSKDIYSKWHSERNKLIIDDIKILHHLYICKKYKQISEIRNELGFSEKKISSSLSRLNNAGLIQFDKDGRFKTLKKSDIFHVKKIISIEAKLKDWRRALDQAVNNSYYASESYTLFPQKAITNKMLETYEQSNIGIISYSDNLNIVKKAHKNTIPLNLNSWLFNEHIGRSLHGNR